MISLPSIGFTAIGENAAFFKNKVRPFCEQYFLKADCFSAYNLEMAFWNIEAVRPSSAQGYCESYMLPQGLECSRNGAFKFWVGTLREMREEAPVGVQINAYLGRPEVVTDV